VICPQCHAEYREGFTECADCGVPLEHSRPPEDPQALARIPGAAPGDPDEDPFCAFWQGEDPRIHAEICQILEEQRIPFRTLRRADHLFNLNTKSAFTVGIPFSCFERAERAVADAYGPPEDGREEAATPPLLALSEQDEAAAQQRPSHWDPRNWFPEDATAEVWSGSPPEMAEIIARSLEENQIHVRSEKRRTGEALLVLPEDESRAREIVSEIVDARPPA
jgi:hypothetical protein